MQLHDSSELMGEIITALATLEQWYSKYVYLKRVKKQSRSRPTNHSIWLYHVLLNERFTHTDH